MEYLIKRLMKCTLFQYYLGNKSLWQVPAFEQAFGVYLLNTVEY